MEDHHILNGAVRQGGGVAGFPGAVVQPLAHNASGTVGAVFVFAVGAVVFVGQLLQVPAVLEAVQHGLGEVLSRLQSRGGFLLGGLHGVALVVGGALRRAGEGDDLIGHMVIGVPVSAVGILQLAVGVSQAVLIGVGVGAVAKDPHQLLAVNLLRDARAEVAFQVLADGDAAGGGYGLEGVHVVVILGLDPGGVLEALGLGGLEGGLNDAHVIQGLVQEIVVPGHAGGSQGVRFRIGLRALGVRVGQLNAQHGGSGGVDGLAF